MEHNGEVIGTVRLAELLADQFFDCVIGFNNGRWKPKLKDRSTVNFLHFHNNGKLETYGTQGFMRSVALEANIFLEGVPRDMSASGFYHEASKREYNKFNKTGDMKIYQINRFAGSMRDTAERLIKKTAKSLPNSMTIESIRSKKKPKNMNVETPEEKERRVVLHRGLSRDGQANFRAMLLNKYHGTCMITGCDTKESLEAAHIIPVSKKGTDSLENGLLLRADLHLLFDAKLMAIDPKTGKVHFSKDAGNHYKKYEQIKINTSIVSRETLATRWQEFNKESE